MKQEEPSLEPYAVRLERFELFSTNQCYYLVGCNKSNTEYRVLKMDRTLIERPAPTPPPRSFSEDRPPTSEQQQPDLHDNSHTAKPTLRPLKDFLSEDPNVYSQAEIKDMLDMIHEGNRLAQQIEGRLDANSPSSSTVAHTGGLKPIVKAYGIIGFVRFLGSYYLTLATRRSKCGSIGGNGIYTIKNTETIALKPAEQSYGESDQNADPTAVLLSMWNRGKRSVGLGLTSREIAELRYQGLYQVVDLTKNFYFSYTIDLTRSLQENFLACKTRPFPPPPYKDQYAWNHFLTREFESCLHSLTSFHWIMPIVHGAFIQRKVMDYGRSLNIILLARRSRHFAGTRYLKRGVSEEGKVANDVEHEQIVHDETNSSSAGIYSSYLQVRGSIPTFWTQESSMTMPKPPIELNRIDPTYRATQLHFEDLLKRYSSPILVLDLVKQSEKREREVRVGNEYRHAIDYINSTIDDEHKVRYCALDYSHISKHRNLDVSASLNEVSTWAVNQTGFFCSAPKWKILEGGVLEPFTEEDGLGAARLTEHLGVPVFPMEQSGILRTNCIDCLDRTNVAQFSAGVEAIGQQLAIMGVRSKAKLDPSSNIVRVLIDMYVDIGDSIALQYGGSEAHKKVTASRSESNITGPIGKHKELLTSIRRYYSNAFTDRLKQDAMNLFLGYYIPYRHTIPLWEMETDYYLHNFHVKDGKGSMYSMKTYQRSFGIDSSDNEPIREKGPGSPNRTSRSTRPHQRDVSIDYDQQESQRIAKVRQSCKAQNEALSAWWKTALQANIKQRMWMQLGGSTSDLPSIPRFDRLYQPEKLGQFDRFFTRGWATPVRRSHTAMQTDGPDADSEGTGLVRVISENFTVPARTGGSDVRPMDEQTLDDFVLESGLAPHQEPVLKTFLKCHDASNHTRAAEYDFLGRLDNEADRVPAEYQWYVGSSGTRTSANTYPEGRVDEFKRILRDNCLKADDVEGITKLAESAHIGETLLSGPYRGLKKDESAISVATAIHEQFNAFESLQQVGGPRLVESELKRQGFGTEGVKQSVAEGWKAFRLSEQQYTEIVDGPMDGCRRSDLTTADSLALYTAAFDPSTSVTTGDKIFLTGEKPDAARSSQVDVTSPPPRTDAFVRKAKRLGIPVMPQSETRKSRFHPLFQFERRRPVPPGFEQINEDMFARLDNKFMVFNHPGVMSWHGTQPVTKVSHVESILLTTLD